MAIDDDNYVKILFRFHNAVLDEVTVETLWATVVDQAKGLYKLDNIPFYVPSVASADIVFAEYDGDKEMLTYRKTVEYSGNSTIQLVMMDKTTDIQVIRELFEEMGCVSEKLNSSYFSMEIASSLDYKKIKQKLDELQQAEVIDYAEACLSDAHRSA